MAAIVYAIPVFILLMLVELAVSVKRGRAAYRLNDAVNSLSLGILSQISGVFLTGLGLLIYVFAQSHFALLSLSADDWRVWIGALVAYDFCYYWNHRLGHECGIFWAAHVVHHQSEDYNLSTALRQTSSGALSSWLFYLPLAFAGVPPLVFIVVGLIDLLYQFWVHTEQIGKLGWFDKVFASPSNHRVHHAVNDRYLDRNYGGILMVWDHLFGTFVDETEPCVYGVRGQLGTFDPLWANLATYADMARASWRTRAWRDKLKVWIAPPGWRPVDIVEMKAPFDIKAMRRYDPGASRTAQAIALAGLIAMIAATAGFLLFAPAWPLDRAIVVFAAIAAVLWAIGTMLDGRISPIEAAFVALAAAACASEALELRAIFVFAKPAATLVALLAALMREGPRDRKALLIAGLGLALIGDALLLSPDLFAAGLAAFLIAQVCYAVMMTRDAGFLPSLGAALAVAFYALAMGGVIWPGVDFGLKGPVAIYILVISWMAAQAIGRALALGGSAARLVALGAVAFLISDTLLAIDKFAWPNEAISLAVLPTYYLAQGLISFCALPRRATR